MAAEDKSQRTEKPTQRRLDKARQKGQGFHSHEATTVVVLVAFLLFFGFGGSTWLSRVKAMLIQAVAEIAAPEITESRLLALSLAAARSMGFLLLAPLGVMAAAGVAAQRLPGHPGFSLEKLKFNPGRMNPVANLGRLFSWASAVEVLKSLAKLVLFTAVAYDAARDAITRSTAGAPGAEGTFQMLADLTWAVLLRVAILGILLAIFDYAWRRFDYHRSMKMTKHEVKEEYKESEGDPHVKARLRQKQLAFARTRMMAAVPRATVVVTNPTHVAVALRYVAGETEVPEVLAKGQDLLAARIRKIAEEHRIPIVEDAPLARALYKSVPVGGTIPAALYRAVAEVLALVLRRRGRRVAGAGREARP